MSKRLVIAALVPLSVLFGNIANFLTQILVPHYVSPAEYSTFGTLWSFGQLLTIIVFEWMRFGVVRFSQGKDQAVASKRRKVLATVYLLAAGLLVSFSIVAYLVSGKSVIVLWLALIAFYAACQGLFDGRQALLRAQFRNGSYSLAWILRSVLTLLFAIGLGYFFRTGVFVVFGICLAYLVALVFLHFFSRINFDRSITFDSSELQFLLRYGAFVAVSSSITAALPALVRLLLVKYSHLGSVGGVILALDLSQKAIVVIGMLVNVVVLQRSIKVVEFGSVDDRRKQMSHHVAITAATILPAAMLFLLLQNSIMTWLVPETYLSEYRSTIGVAIIGAALLCFRQFSIDSLFVVIGKSTYSIVGPIASVFFTVLFIYIQIWFFSLSGLGVCLAMLFGLLLGLMVSFFAVSRVTQVSWPYKDILFALLGCAAMFVVVHLVRLPGESNVTEFLRVGCLCVAVYSLFSYAVNLCGVRTRLRDGFVNRR